jgi:deoxyribodipyrimidine photo-lyase
MSRLFRRAAVWLRRDLRLQDHGALRRAAALAEEVAFVFVFDPRQLAPHPWRSEPGLAFLARTLADLEAELRAQSAGLWTASGDPAGVWPLLAAEAGIDLVVHARDVTPFAAARDAAVTAALRAVDVRVEAVDDVLLSPDPQVLRTVDGRPYRVFTPYWRAARTLPVAAPAAPAGLRLLSPPAAWAFHLPPEIEGHAPPEPFLRGGRREGERLLVRLGDLGDYATRRDLPADDGTSGLSAHLKFGTVSPREVWHAIAAAHGPESPLLRQLYWRDFFSQLALHHPHVFGGAFVPAFDAVAWRDDPAALAAWQEGRTGVPIVDAGMRQLTETGWMHNRVRMITASFLVKDLHLDWRLGEQWFARRLVDYDPAVNNGNWQWAASTGADAQPWFRIFNPWRQAARFDPEARYIKRWLPELAGLDAADLHRLDRHRPLAMPRDYPPPIVDHSAAAARAKAMFAAAAGR